MFPSYFDEGIPIQDSKRTKNKTATNDEQLDLQSAKTSNLPSEGPSPKLRGNEKKKEKKSNAEEGCGW